MQSTKYGAVKRAALRSARRFCGRALTKRRIDEHRIVELSGRRRDVNRLHLLERTERMAFRDELIDRTLMKCARDEQNDIIDHVRVPLNKQHLLIAFLSIIK